MAKKNDTTFFENKLLDFVTAKDPMLEMLQWVMVKFMEIEVAHRTGAEKGIHAESRTGYRCGYRIRRFDTRLGTVYLSVPKIRQGGYIPFFVTEKKRSEQAFDGCSSLKEITIPKKVRNIGKWAFFGTDIKSITIPPESDTYESFDAETKINYY